MNNYPNMSYCMCENTLLAMEQILTAMQDDPDFFRDMSRIERNAYQELYNRARAFTCLSDQLAEESFAGWYFPHVSPSPNLEG